MLSAILGSALACNKSCRVVRHTLAGLQSKTKMSSQLYTNRASAFNLTTITTKLKLNLLMRNVQVKCILFRVFSQSHFTSFPLTKKQSVNSVNLALRTGLLNTLDPHQKCFCHWKLSCLQLTERQKNCLSPEVPSGVFTANLKKQQSSVILDLCLRKTRTRKTHDSDRHVIVFKISVFKNAFPVSRAFSKSFVFVTDWCGP